MVTAPAGSKKEQLRKDRITAVLVFVIIAALFGLMVWLGMLDSGFPANDIWPMLR